MNRPSGMQGHSLPWLDGREISCMRGRHVVWTTPQAQMVRAEGIAPSTVLCIAKLMLDGSKRADVRPADFYLAWVAPFHNIAKDRYRFQISPQMLRVKQSNGASQV